MEQLPIYIKTVFILTTLITVLLMHKAGHSSKSILLVVFWLVLQAIIGLTGFYTVTKGTPPRLTLLLIPPIVFIAILFFTKKGIGIIEGFDTKTLTLLHIIRVPVELCLYWLYLYKAVPEVMTFEGRNVDILCGLTAPLVYYFGYLKNVLSRKVLVAWNILCLLLLANIVVTAILSAPYPSQRFGFDQPNVALFYFPFVWLPCYIVPMALFSHLVTIRELIKEPVKIPPKPLIS